MRDFFWNTGNRLKTENGSILKEVWEEEAKKLSATAHLNGNECDNLIAVADSLGYLDLTQQTNNIELYLQSVDESIEALSGKYEQTSRMYMSLGVMAGLFLTIILI